MTTEPLRSVVTGAANGIGRAVADRLLARGDRVVGLDREDAGNGVPMVVADLSDAPQRAAAIQEAREVLGGVDVLVNVAGAFREGGILDSALDDWRSLWTLDLDAPIALMAAVAPGMVENGFGRIVNVTSVHAGHGQPGCLAYDVAKAGLEAATRSAAIDLGRHGVLVNAVAPGFVRTKMSLLPDGTDETHTSAFRTVYVDRGKLPLGRPAEPAEVSPAVAFLCARENTYTTGEVLTVDGGLTATF
jgi:NAD(P)-dependent dehydrogenase (short-subunit alcohol dehydrogenase family)